MCGHYSDKDPPTPQSRVRFDAYTDDAVSTAVIEALAEVTTVEAADGDFVLHDYIEPDALDMLFDQAADTIDLTLTIGIDEYDVTIDNDGWVVVTAGTHPDHE